MTRVLRCCLAAVLLLATNAHADSGRFGAIEGSWEACVEKTKALSARIEAAQAAKGAPATFIAFLQHQLAVELDRCAQKPEASAEARLEVMSMYQAVGEVDRAIQIGVDAIAAIGATPALELQLAKLLYKKGLKDRAAGLLEQVIASRSSDLDANRLLGAYAYEKGDYLRAVRSLRVVAEAEPNDFEANAALGDACLKANDLDCAGEFLAVASKLKPSDVLLAVRVGDLQRTRGDFGTAVIAYERALTVAPKRADALAGMGLAYEGAGFDESAQWAWARLQSVDAANPDAAVHLSRMLRRLHRERSAVLDDAVRAAPRADVLTEVSLVLLREGAAERALSILDSATAQVAADDRVLAVRGDVVLARGKPELALAHYRDARRARPTEAVYMVREARALRALNRPSEADAILTGYVGTSPAIDRELAMARLDTARQSAGHAQFAAARERVTAALAVAPDDRSMIASAAILAISAGDAAAGDEALTKLPPSFERNLADAWRVYRAGPPAEAVKAAEIAAAGSRLPGTQLLRAATLLNAQQPDQALALLDAAGDVGAYRLWREAALAQTVQTQLKAGHFDDATKLARRVVAAPYSAAAAHWLPRAAQVGDVALGRLRAEKTVTIALSAAKQPTPLDALLLACNDMSHASQEAALKRVRGLPESAVVKSVRSRAQLDLAAQSFRKGKQKDVRDTLAHFEPDGVPGNEARVAFLTMSNATALDAMLAALNPLAATVPEAAINAAIADERTHNSGAVAIPWLQRVVEAPALSKERQGAVATLLGLKQRLY